MRRLKIALAITLSCIKIAPFPSSTLGVKKLCCKWKYSAFLRSKRHSLNIHTLNTQCSRTKGLPTSGKKLRISIYKKIFPFFCCEWDMWYQLSGYYSWHNVCLRAWINTLKSYTNQSCPVNQQISHTVVTDQFLMTL